MLIFKAKKLGQLPTWIPPYQKFMFIYSHSITSAPCYYCFQVLFIIYCRSHSLE